MIYPVYCIKDVKGEFWSPRIEQNEASAKRSFAQLCSQPDTLLNYAPNDFEYYYIGEFDSHTGLVKSLNMPEFLCRGSEFCGGKYEE